MWDGFLRTPAGADGAAQRSQSKGLLFSPACSVCAAASIWAASARVTLLFMGKTAFTRGLARGLGCTGRVTSPTFTIVNEYEGPVPLFHFDMYRLADADALFDIGWDDYLGRGGVCAVEWSEQVEDALPEGTLTVTLRRHPDNDGWRIITVEGDETA